jgi:hypothetical protein
MSKGEIIQKAWIETQSHINSEGVPNYNDDGWAKYGGKQKSEYFKTLDEKEWLGYWFYRPKSLDGIEDNNGWIEIDSKDDLPKEDIDCYFILKSNKVILSGRFRGSCFDYATRYYDENDVSYYQEIIKPREPLY